MQQTVTPVLGGKGRLFQALFEGDPVAWAILGAVVVLSGVGWFWRRMRS